MMDEENNGNDIKSIILQAITEQRNTVFLELCYVIYESTDHQEKAKRVLKILSDQDLIRQIRQVEALTEENENKIYYLENDEYSPKKLLYKQQLELTIRNIRNEQLKQLSTILKELNEEEEIEL